MPKYVILRMGRQEKILKVVNSRSAALKWRKAYFKRFPRRHVAIFSKRGLVIEGRGTALWRKK